ncbi:MAG: hypothetical protein ACKVQC_00860 [Elusimicrobiota bacterium]
MKKLLFIGLSLGLVGCAGPKYLVKVDSIKDVSLTTGTRFNIQPGDLDVSSGDLHFRLYANSLKNVLEKKGWEFKAAISEADMIIQLRYGTGAPETTTQLYTTPVYSYEGGQRATIDRVEKDGDKTKTVREQIYVHPEWKLVDHQVNKVTSTSYTSYAVIEAVLPHKLPSQKQFMPLWKTTIKLTGPSADLRLTMLLMLDAVEPYLGTDTGQEISLSLDQKLNKK